MKSSSHRLGLAISTIPAAITCAMLALVPAAASAQSIRFTDLVNPYGHVYMPGDLVTIGVTLDSGFTFPVSSIHFHMAGPPELVLVGVDQHPPAGWDSSASVGGVCDLLDPYGLCGASLYASAPGGAFLLDEMISTLTYEVVGGLGAVPIFAAFVTADGDGIFGSVFDPIYGYDLTPVYSQTPTFIEVPEPSMATLLVFGAASVAAARRHRLRRGARRDSRPPPISGEEFTA